LIVWREKLNLLESELIACPTRTQLLTAKVVTKGTPTLENSMVCGMVWYPTLPYY
jgi:hypothetical protein